MQFFFVTRSNMPNSIGAQKSCVRIAPSLDFGRLAGRWVVTHCFLRCVTLDRFKSIMEKSDDRGYCCCSAIRFYS